MNDPPSEIIAAMNNDLLASTGPQEAKEPEPKRNSKDDIITKIIKSFDVHISDSLDPLIDSHSDALVALSFSTKDPVEFGVVPDLLAHLSCQAREYQLELGHVHSVIDENSVRVYPCASTLKKGH